MSLKAHVTIHYTRKFNYETVTYSTSGALNSNPQRVIRSIFGLCTKYISSIILPSDPNSLYATCTMDDLKGNEFVHNRVSVIQKSKINSLERGHIDICACEDL